MQHSGSPVLQPQAQPSQRVCVSLPTKYLRLELSVTQLLTLSCPFFSLPDSGDHNESDSERKGHSGLLRGGSCFRPDDPPLKRPYFNLMLK